MNVVGEQCAGKPPALFDEGALCNGRALLYYFRHSAESKLYIEILIKEIALLMKINIKKTLVVVIVFFLLINGLIIVISHINLTQMNVNFVANVPLPGQLGIIDNISVGTSPKDAAFDNLNGYVYVTNYGSNSVSIINGTTNTVIKNISVGTSPKDAAFDNLNGYVYVTNSGSNSVSIINGTTNTVIKNISGGGKNPVGAAFDNLNGYVYIMNSGSNNMSIINGTTNTVIKNISVGTSPRGAAFDNLNGYVYVMNAYSNTISVLGYIQKYSITFTEINLPSNTKWAVSINGFVFTSTTFNISFAEPNGTYTYTITSNNKQYTTSQSIGSITINGSAKFVSITFRNAFYSNIYPTIRSAGIVFAIASISILLMNKKHKRNKKR